MTVSTSTNKAIFLGNGATNLFTYTFNMVDASYVVLTYTTAAGLQSPISPGAYTITISPTGGVLTYPLVGAAIASGTSLTLQRVVPYVQATSLSNVGALYPTVIEGMGDTLEYQTQQLAEQMNRAVLMNAADNIASGVLPAAALRADRVLGFDAAGAVTLYAQGSVVPVPPTPTATDVLYTATGTGAVARSTASRLGDFVMITDYGADPSGVSDCSTALTRALAVINAKPGGGTIYFPAGVYRFTSSVTYTYPAVTAFSVSIVGAGADATTLYWPASDGLLFNLSTPGHSIHVRDMTFATGALDTYTGLTIKQSVALGVYDSSDITNVVFRGLSIATATQCWVTACFIEGLCSTNIVGCSVWGATIAGVFHGVGFLIQGSALITNNFSVIQNFTSCQFTFLQEGITYGDYLQGMTLSQCNFTQVNYGIYQHIGSGAVGVGAQLVLNNCQIAANQFGIALLGAIGDVAVTGSLFYSAVLNAVGFYTGAASLAVRVALAGNMFEGNNTAGTQGIVVTGITTSLAVTGNVLYGYVTGIDIAVGCTVTHGSITGNTIHGIGTANLGITLAGTSSYIVLTGNGFMSLGTAINLSANSSHCNVQSNSYAASVTNTVVDAGAANTVGGGST